MRSGGASTSEIISAGGGLSSTVTVTRGTDPWTLCNQVSGRMRDWLLSGTTTIEAKTGYHLTRDGELADVRLLRSLEDESGMPRVHVTFLAAHSVPPEYFGRAQRLRGRGQCLVRGRRRRRSGQHRRPLRGRRFSEPESRWILDAGRAAGLLPRLHANGDPRLGAARLAAELGCASADLLNGADDDDVAVLAKAGVTAVVCPASPAENGRVAPVRALLDRGVMVALGTGHSPGTNGITSMPLVITLAVANLGMSVTEALRAATVGGAHALRAPDRGAMTRGQARRRRCLGR